MEGPLSADGRDAAGRGLQRIIRYEGRSGGRYEPRAQYAYRTDPGLGLVELVAVGDDLLLALERGFTAGVGNTVRVYRVSATRRAPTCPRGLAGHGDRLADVAGQAAAGRPRRLPAVGRDGQAAAAEPVARQHRGHGARRRARRPPRCTSSPTTTTAPRRPPGCTRCGVNAAARRRACDARAILSATAYQPGPVSGTQLPPTPVNGITPPFPGQPIPGFSAVIPARPGDTSADRLLAMPDNGFGAKNNSADFLLRAYEIEPNYRRHTVDVNGLHQLPRPRPQGAVPDRQRRHRRSGC